VHTEEALLASERRFMELIRHSSDSISIVDLSGRQISVSDAVEKMVGYTAAELTGVQIADVLIHPDDRERALAALRKVVLEGSDTVQYRHRHKDGSWVWIEAHGSNQLDNPDIRGVVINARDITERVEAEQERSRLECQLQQAQKMEAVGRLAGGVAHDFNNMLGAIMGFTELALQAEDPAALQANLEEIRRAAERSAELTRQLLAFARRQTVAPQLLDLNRTVEHQTRMLQRLIGENIELIWTPGEDLAPVWMDPTQVDQLLTNLCVNARDAIADVGRIRIETANCVLDEAYCAAHPDATGGAHVRLSVIDDGCGMSPQTLARLFEPFFTTKEVGKGTGLGLAMVHGIVRQNGGHITVHSAPGEGSTFCVYLPRQPVTVTPPVVPAPVPTAAAGSGTILLVEDEPAILRLTRKMLERHGYTVLAADSPFEAIRLADLHRNEIDLLLTDVIMPGMNGRDLAVRLTAANPRLRCLFMSGYTADVLDPHGVLHEDVHFLQKPFSMTVLGEQVRLALDA
jgi:PAS domain S-box-containing protein